MDQGTVFYRRRETATARELTAEEIGAEEEGGLLQGANPGDFLVVQLNTAPRVWTRDDFAAHYELEPDAGTIDAGAILGNHAAELEQFAAALDDVRDRVAELEAAFSAPAAPPESGASDAWPLDTRVPSAVPESGSPDA